MVGSRVGALNLECFFDAREMQQRIIADRELQPDHYMFNERRARTLIREYSEKAAYIRFVTSYETFIVAFREFYALLERFDTSRLEPLEFARAAIAEIRALYGGVVFGQGLNATVVAQDGNTFSVGGIIEGTFDTLKLVIDYAAYKRKFGKTVADQPVDLSAFFSQFNAYRMIKRDWQDCLWLDNLVNVEPEIILSNPVQVGRRIGLYRDSFRRLSVNGPSVQVLAKESWFQSEELRIPKKLPRNFGKYVKTVIAEMPYPYLEKMLSLKANTPYTMVDLFKCYVLLKFIAIRNFHPTGPGNFRFTRESLEKFVATILGVSVKLAEIMLGELCLRENQDRDIWLTPLLSEPMHYILLVPMAATANVERMVENTLARHAADSKGTGRLFEDYAFDSLSRILPKSQLRNVAKIVHGRELLCASGPLEVDLFIGINRTLFVCELKHTGFPAEDQSVYRYFNVIRGGCVQATKKAELLKVDWARLASELDFSPGIEIFRPLLVTGKYFGSGLCVGDVPVIAIQDLEDFLLGEIYFDVTWDGDLPKHIGKTVKTFESAKTADLDLWESMHQNPRLRHYRDKLSFRAYTRDYKKQFNTSFRYSQFELWLETNSS